MMKRKKKFKVQFQWVKLDFQVSRLNMQKEERNKVIILEGIITLIGEISRSYLILKAKRKNIQKN